MDIDQLPTLKDAIPQMLDLIDAVRREITLRVPATAPWSWSGDFASDGCEAGGQSVYFPRLISSHAFTDTEWALVLPEVTRLAADAGLTDTSAGPANKAGNYDVSFTSADGRRLRFGSRYAILLTAHVGCRRPGDLVRVDGRIPTPPDPQP